MEEPLGKEILPNLLAVLGAESQEQLREQLQLGEGLWARLQREGGNTEEEYAEAYRVLQQGKAAGASSEEQLHAVNLVLLRKRQAGRTALGLEVQKHEYRKLTVDDLYELIDKIKTAPPRAKEDQLGTYEYYRKHTPWMLPQLDQAIREAAQGRGLSEPKAQSDGKWEYTYTPKRPATRFPETKPTQPAVHVATPGVAEATRKFLLSRPAPPCRLPWERSFVFGSASLPGPGHLPTGREHLGSAVSLLSRLFGNPSRGKQGAGVHPQPVAHERLGYHRRERLDFDDKPGISRGGRSNSFGYLAYLENCYLWGLRPDPAIFPTNGSY